MEEQEKELREALEGLRRLHAEVDEAVRVIAGHHGPRLQCRRGCSACCIDGLEVAPVEAARIRAEHAELLREGRPHPAGACALLDEEGACRIYPSRPYRCRTQGLPLRWFEEDPAGGVVEWRDICSLNDAGGPSVESLPEEDCWTIGPIEGRLAALAPQGAEKARIALRDLFRETEGEGRAAFRKLPRGRGRFGEEGSDAIAPQRS